jgi:hypothetical protein
MSSGTDRKRYVSFDLVHSGRVNRGRHREISHAHAHDYLLDDRAGHHRVDYWRRRYPHVFTASKRTISSRRSYFFHARRDPGSFHLLQTKDPFSQFLIAASEVTAVLTVLCATLQMNYRSFQNSCSFQLCPSILQTVLALAGEDRTDRFELGSHSWYSPTAREKMSKNRGF